MSSVERQPDTRTPASLPVTVSPDFWRSLDQLADTPRFRAFLEAEFPAEADPQGISRRRWLQVMGASLALAGASGCRWERQEIRPLVNRPEDRTPGKTRNFATVMPLGDSAMGLEVTTVDGRPIKIEGNPRHPQSLGATDVFAQAAILELYDPDRSRSVQRDDKSKEGEADWDAFTEFAREHFDRLRKNNGAGFRILAEANGSPTLVAMRAELLKSFPLAKWYEYESISEDNRRAGSKLAFGKAYRTDLALDKAQVIVCLDADPLGSHPAAVRYARDFAEGRQPDDGKMNRLYAIESRLSITGAAADHRLATRCGEIPLFAAALAETLAEIMANPDAWNAAKADSKAREAFLAMGALADFSVAVGLAFSTKETGDIQRVPRFFSQAKLFYAVLEDLLADPQQSLVVAGRSQPPEVHAAVHRINAMLENVGPERPVRYVAEPDPERPSHVEAIRSLAEEMSAEEVGTLLILGGNPVYDAPSDVPFADALEKVPTRIHLGLYHDETARRCNWHLPRAHFLESWGDARAWDGTYGVVQPMIAPLHGGRSAIELLGWIVEGQWPDARQLVRKTFDRIAGEISGASWRRTVRDGQLEGSARPLETPSIDLTAKPVAPEPPKTDDTLEIVFCRDASVHDGRFANNGWLQEMPDPLSRLTWGNAALINPATAKALGVEDGTLVKLQYKGRELRMPAYLMPGQAQGSVAVSLGYGRTAAGCVGGQQADEIESAGFDVGVLRTSGAMDFDTGLTVEPTGLKYPLASVQDHFAVDNIGRAGKKKRLGSLVRQATLEHYEKHPDFAQHSVHHPPLESLWEEPTYEGHRWGMAIDLTKCIGCGACVVACQAENNVPIVGKEQVEKGREMQWLRVDRYFHGEPDADDSGVGLGVVFQPLPCQQCELAPCEQVCPVAATTHSSEGLNDMVYNRCVGTRYCANNCPYKVRRFNYFNYHKDLEEADNEVAKMKYNPQVTVRSRGVMEKCTYCVQRIQAAKIGAKNRGGTVQDGAIQTACQQVCPTGAIVFGDLAHAEGEEKTPLLKLHQSDRAYAMLEELNLKPRTKYLARIRNPNPELEPLDTNHDGHPG